MNIENKYCVYLHRRKDNDKVFYVGQGTEQRAFSKHRKLKEWHNVVSSFGYYVQILHRNLSKVEALCFEQKYISIYQHSLLNLPESSSFVKEMKFEVFDKYFYIDQTSPSGLRRKIDIFAGTKHKAKIASVGDPVGRIASDGYYSVQIFGKVYRVHRIIYLLSKGTVDSNCVIDHINKIKTDNRIENLRQVSQSENTRNKTKMSNNTVGVGGISFHKTSGSYRPAIVDTTGKRHFKSFSVNKYGEQKALELAIAWRKQKEIEYGFN